MTCDRPSVQCHTKKSIACRVKIHYWLFLCFRDRDLPSLLPGVLVKKVNCVTAVRIYCVALCAGLDGLMKSSSYKDDVGTILGRVFMVTEGSPVLSVMKAS